MKKALLTAFLILTVLGMSGIAAAERTWTMIPSAPDELKNPQISVDRDATLWTVSAEETWLRFNRVVYRYDGLSWDIFTKEDGLQGYYAQDIGTGAGSVWCLFDSGISRFNGNGWDSYPVLFKGKNEVWDDYRIAVASDGTVFCGMSGVLMSCKDGVWQKHGVDNGLPVDDPIVYHLAANTSGQVCVSFLYADYDNMISHNGEGVPTLTGGCYVYDGTEWKKTRINMLSTIEDFEDHVHTLTSAPDGSFWCCYSYILYELVDDLWQPRYRDDELGVNALSADSEGAIWLSLGDSIACYDGDTMTKYNESTGYSGGEVYAITGDDNGNVWVAAENGHFKYKSSDTAVEKTVPETFRIHACYPNPFNPSTTICYSTESECDVTLNIYNSAGQKVRELESGRVSAGKHLVLWDGCDDRGVVVSAGVYFAEMRSAGLRSTAKLTLMK